MKHVESDLQKSIVDFVNYALPHVLIFSVPNGAHLAKKKNPKTGKWYCPQMNQLKAEGLLNGAPDLIMFWEANDGNRPYLACAALEVKSPVGVLSEAQKAFARKFMGLGGSFYKCPTFDDFLHVLSLLGLKHNAVLM